MSDTHKYDDIINLSHHVSANHPHMSALDRAAQFSPFAALTGHDAAIRETARLTDSLMELTEEGKELLDERLQMLRVHLAERPEVTFTYYEPDEKKSGGEYITVHGRVKKLNELEHQIVLEDGSIVPIENLFAVEGEQFAGWMAVEE